MEELKIKLKDLSIISIFMFFLTTAFDFGITLYNYFKSPYNFFKSELNEEIIGALKYHHFPTKIVLSHSIVIILVILFTYFSLKKRKRIFVALTLILNVVILLFSGLHIYTGSTWL